MKETLAYHIMALYRDFLAYTTEELKELGLSFGQMPLILYVGRRPGCTQADLTKDLHLDWGYSQRAITKLVSTGFLEIQHNGQCNCLTLTETGNHAFQVCHSVFSQWDRQKTAGLSPDDTQTLLTLLGQIPVQRKES